MVIKHKSTDKWVIVPVQGQDRSKLHQEKCHPAAGNLPHEKQNRSSYRPLFSTVRGHFTAMNLLATTDILEQLKDERLKIKFKPYSDEALPKGKVKIKSSISAQFKSCIGDIPITRTIKGEKV